MGPPSVARTTANVPNGSATTQPQGAKRTAKQAFEGKCQVCSFRFETDVLSGGHAFLFCNVVTFGYDSASVSASLVAVARRTMSESVTPFLQFTNPAYRDHGFRAHAFCSQRIRIRRL